MRFLLAAWAVAAFVAVPAFADTASTTPVAAPIVPEKKICRSEDVTGSNLPETHCHTKAEWVQLEKQHDAEIRSLRDGGHWSSNGH